MLEMFKNQSGSKMESGEELLGKAYNITTVDRVEKILVGQDCGSTQTRCVILKQGEGEEELEKVYTVPSVFSSLQSYEEILPQGDRLYDNMDAWITSSSSEPDGLFDKIRVLKGTKRSDANVSTNRINSTKQKIDTPAFYLNSIDSIVYSLIMKGGPIAKEYNVYLGITLPPDNVVSKPNRDLFFRRIIRSFDFENKDLGIKTKINIKNVEVQTEPEAVLRGYKVKYSEEDEEGEDKVALMIEIGGSTVGTAIIQEGTSIRAAAQTLNYGGTQLQNSLGSLFSEKHGGGNITQKQLKLALENGIIKAKGKGHLDVTDECILAKKEFASRVYSDLYNNVFDQLGNSEVDMVDIGQVYFGGRTCNSGSYNEEYPNGYSITQPLAEMLKKDLPDAEFITVPDNLIPYGNAIKAFVAFSSEFLEEETEEEFISKDEVESEIE